MYCFINMFEKFSQHFYQLATFKGYQLNTSNQIDYPFWAMAAVENATLSQVWVLDAARYDTAHTLLEVKEQAIHQHEELLERFHNVMVIYLLVTESESPPLWPADIEPYYGQSSYRVFWQLDLQTGKIILPDGQPAELFGLRALAEKALASASGGEEVTYRENKEIKPKHRVVFTWVLMVANAIVLTLMYLDGYAHDYWTALRFGAILPESIIYGGQYYRFFTAMFVHFGWQHLIMNTAGLYIFGTRVEKYLGAGYFVFIYIVSGLCGSIASLFLTRGYSAGASGAIFGLVGVAFAFTRITKQRMDNLSDYFLLIYILMAVGMGFTMRNVDNFGHLGGLLAGLLLGAVVTKRRF